MHKANRKPYQTIHIERFLFPVKSGAIELEYHKQTFNFSREQSSAKGLVSIFLNGKERYSREDGGKSRIYGEGADIFAEPDKFMEYLPDYIIASIPELTAKKQA